MTDDEDLHRGGDAATALTPEERVGLIPTWIVTRDDLNRAERAISPWACAGRDGRASTCSIRSN